MGKGKMDKGTARTILLALPFLAILLLLASFAYADETFPGLFEVKPPCLSTNTCGVGENLTVDGVGIMNILATPANGINDGFVTGVLSNVTWFTTVDGTAPYLMDSSVWQVLPNGSHSLLAENSTANSAYHFVQIGPFNYSSSCPSSGCNLTVFVKSCNSTYGVCVNSTAQAGGTITPIVGPATYLVSISPIFPRTGDLVNVSWRTVVPMNDTLSWVGGSSSDSTNRTLHTKLSSPFNATENVTFSILSCLNGVCENETRAITIGYSSSSVSLSTTAPSVPITASWTTHNLSNSSIFYSVNSLPIQNTVGGTNSTSHSASIGPFSANDVLTYYVRACLFPNSCEQTENTTLTIGQAVTTTTAGTTTTTSGGGSGPSGPGGSGPGGIVLPPSFPAGADISYKQVPVNAPVSFSFNASRQAITTILFSYKQFIPNATIYIVNLGTNPGTAAPPGTVYQYDNITHAAILDSQLVVPVTIDFRVSKSWVKDNNIDVSTISLFRQVSAGWQAISTESRGEDATYYYFRSSSPGLSLFAITGQRRTAFWDIIGLIESYYNKDPSVDFWRVLDALTSYYASSTNY